MDTLPAHAQARLEPDAERRGSPLVRPVVASPRHLAVVRVERSVDFRHPALPERFWAKVRDLPGGCWEWVGGFGAGDPGARYPTFHDDECLQSRGAHRVAYERLIGPVPDGLVLDHYLHPGGCVGRACVNPAHLRPTTINANGRRERGNRCFSLRHELTPENTLWQSRGRGRDRHRLCRTCREERELRTGKRRRMRVTATLSIVAVSAPSDEVAEIAA